MTWWKRTTSFLSTKLPFQSSLPWNSTRYPTTSTTKLELSDTQLKVNISLSYSTKSFQTKAIFLQNPEQQNRGRPSPTPQATSCIPCLRLLPSLHAHGLPVLLIHPFLYTASKFSKFLELSLHLPLDVRWPKWVLRC